MEEIIDLIATDSSPSDISNKIKEVLFTKAAERIENAKPLVASRMFSGIENEESEE
jgi:hypothetical protein